MIKKDAEGNIMVFKGETDKARERREKEGWFEKYAPADKSGLDIGCKNDPLNWTFRRWDLKLGDGDATELQGVPNETYWTVYASHVLEHIPHHRQAIRRWYEVLKTGGNLIICVPHRDLYEMKRTLPSNWNKEHCRFWLPDGEDPPNTLCLKTEILLAIPEANIISYRVLADGYQNNCEPGPDGRVHFLDFKHPSGEYAIEAIIKK